MQYSKKKKKNFMAPFYGWGSTASRLEPLRGGSLLFTTKYYKAYLKVKNFYFARKKVTKIEFFFHGGIFGH